jgi:hypothetical protein
VARGYTEPDPGDRARFVIDPVRNTRWVRTGDLARRRDDGALDLIGRLDDQVKIRGVLVQPDAVEAVLRGVPGVTDAAVVPGGEPPRLVAYLEGAALPDPALREHVRAALPAAFVPAVFVRVAALPRLTSGKLARGELRAHAVLDAASDSPPASQLEQLVARHWAAQLGIAPGDARGEFFALGGSSLGAVELAGRLGDALGQAVPASLVFDRPTIAEQAAWLAEQLDRGSPSEPARPRLVRIDRAGGRPLALSFAQERMWLGEALARGEPGPRVHRGLVLTGALDEARLEAAMCAAADRHEALRTTFAADAGRPHQIVHASLPRDHQTIDLTGRTDPAELARVWAEARSRAFELERGPLWRTRLVRLAPDRHAVLLTIHHLVTDGWSMRRWLDEVSARYADTGAALPALAVQPADVADWQRRCIADGAYDRARGYWRDRLAGAAARPELPHDGPRDSAVGAWIHGELAAPQLAALRELARSEGCTLFMVLGAALAELVAEWTGEHDVTIGTLSAGRDRPELRPLIGLFLNALPLRIRVDRAAGLRGTLASARDTTLGALAHAELPFERIVAELNPPRQPRRNPLFDVVLNDLPPASVRTLGDLEATALDPGPEVSAPFDVMWRVVADEPSLKLRIEYRRGRFAEPRVRRWLARYLELLASAAAG